MSTVALLVEAVDTVRALGWALAVWIVLMAVTVMLALYTLAVAVWVPCSTAQEAVTAALAASRALRALPEHLGAHNTAHARTSPSWARKDAA